MTSNGNPAKDGLTRRALILAAPALLVPGSVYAALKLTPGAGEGPFYPVQRPSDDDSDLVRVEGAVREAGVAALPLSAFYDQAPVRHIIRLCFAKRDETLAAGIERLRAARRLFAG